MVFARGQPVCGHERRDSMQRLRLIILGIGLLGARMAVACIADAGPDITAVPGMPVLLAGSGSGTGDLQYTWFPTEGLSDPHAAQPSLLAPATTTTYTLSVTDASGCSTNSHVTVTVVPWPAVLLVAAGAEVTTTEVDDMPAFVYCGGAPQWTFALADATPPITGAVRTIDPGDGTPPETLPPGGTFVHSYTAGQHVMAYTVTVPGSWSVTQQFVAYVGSAPPPPVVSTNSPVCMGQVLSVSTAAMGGVAYAWTGPNGFTSTQPTFVVPGATSVQAGTYTVTPYKGACTGPSTSITVDVVAPPVVTVQPAAVDVCAGTPITLEASGAADFTWTQGVQTIGTGATLQLEATATAYLVVSGESQGCSSTTVVPVVVRPLPQVDIAPLPTLCDQPVPVELVATPAGGTWSGPHVDANGIFTAQPGATGTFALAYTVTDQYGCTGTQQVMAQVQSVDQPATVPAPFSLCADAAPVPLAAQPPGGEWTGPVAPDGLFTPGAPGTYAFTYAVGSGSCRTEAQTTIAVHALPTVQADVPAVVCSDQGAIALQGLPAGGSWAGTGVSGGLFDPTGLAQGTYPLSYTWTDPATGCTSTAPAQVQLTHPPVAGFDLPAVACAGTLLDLASYTEGTIDQVSWDLGDGHTAQGAAIAHAYAAPGTYTVQLAYTNACGTATAAHTVQVLPATTTAAIDPPVLSGCAPFTATLTALTTGDTALTWSWAGGTATAPVLTHTFSTPGEHMVQLQAEGCLPAVATAIVHVHAPPQAAALIAPGPVCAGAPIALHNATPGTTAAWTIDDGTTSAESSWTHVFAQPGTWHIDLVTTDPATGCADTATHVLLVPPAPTAVPELATTPACAGALLHFVDAGEQAVAHAWAFGDGATATGAAPAHAYAHAGAYGLTLVVTGAGGCTDTAHLAIAVHGLPPAGFTHLPTGSSGLAVHFSAPAGATTYHWDFGDGRSSALQDPLHHFDAPGDQEVCLTTTNAAGCANTTCHVVRVLGSDDVWMPSAFSPDGDGINDLLRPVVAGDHPVGYRFTVMDRWGGVVFTTNDPHAGWDGTQHGSPVDAGVYVWHMEWRQGDIARQRFGHVTVVR